MTLHKQIGKQSHKLHRRQTKLGSWFAFLLICLFWNGIIGVFIYQVISGSVPGAMGIFLGIFLIPFVLVGLGLIFVLGYTTLNLFNPTIDLTVDRNEVHLGDEIKIKWQVKGAASRITRLVIALEGVEHATYGKGTRTYTDTSMFAQVPIISTEKARQIESGSFTIAVPKEVMHSFEANNNKILWSVVAKGTIPKWPDANEIFALTVLPARLTRGEHNA